MIKNLLRPFVNKYFLACSVKMNTNHVKEEKQMKKILQFCLLSLLTIALFFLSGCGVKYYETEDGIWLYRVLTEEDRPNNPERVGTVAIVSILNPEAGADENGFILIPHEIGEYQVSELGDIGDGIFLYTKDNKPFYLGSNIERIIIPAEIKTINVCFFVNLSAKYVEFLGNEPYIRIVDVYNIDTTCWIVPNGVKEGFLNSGNIVGWNVDELDRIIIMEKWEIDGYLEE